MSHGLQRVLVVEGEFQTRESITFHLHASGFGVEVAANGAEALRKARSYQPDLITLELTLPGISGVEVCEQLRIHPETARIPFIILSARTTEADRILGLELGALDYMTKPFSPRELILRIRRILALLARESRGETLHQIGELTIDVRRRIVTINRSPIEVTATEFRLLTALAIHRGHVKTRAELLADIWERESATNPRAIDTHIRRLRQKLGTSAGLLKTVLGTGYRLSDC